MRKQKGQVVLILILVMTVALAIGISVVQRSLSDISTSTKVEQSSRAFSAAEAGIEQALIHPDSVSRSPVTFTENQSEATVQGGPLIPCVPGASDCAQTSGAQQVALEHPPIPKEKNIHIWLADPRADLPTNCAGYVCYNPPTRTLDVYWGDPAATDRAALELTLIYWDGNKYNTRKWYLDPINNRGNNFISVISSCNDNNTPQLSTTKYRCHFSLDSLPTSGLMMLTARLLYNSTSQPFAVQAVACSGGQTGCSIPPQAREFISTGKAGQTQRRIKLYQTEKVAPPYFDYGLFSAGDINKGQ